MSKLGLLIGINYNGTSTELRGCINDVLNLKNKLIEKFGYMEENIVTLTDETSMKPTANNIVMQLYELVIKANNNPDVKEVWFSYSGHGTYVKDSNSDEDDGKDECLVPLDYNKSGVISDDLLHHIVSMLNADKKMTCIIDACHSGTSLDLPFRYVFNDNENVIENKHNKVKANVISISGCLDTQTSADAYGLENSSSFSGAMTSSLLHSLEKYSYTISCVDLLREMRDYLRIKKFSQVPQLCSSRCIVPTTFFCVDKSNVFIL